MKKKSWIAVTIGAAAGFVTGILTAPKSGKETRKDIKDAASKIATETEEKLKQLYKNYSKHAKTLEAQIKKVSGKSKKELIELQQHVVAVRKKIKDLLSDIHDGLAESDDADQAIREAEAIARKVARVGKSKAK